MWRARTWWWVEGGRGGGEDKPMFILHRLVECACTRYNQVIHVCRPAHPILKSCVTLV